METGSEDKRWGSEDVGEGVEVPTSETELSVGTGSWGRKQNSLSSRVRLPDSG